MIAIIAILAAILFPVFAQAREKAHQSTCQNNEYELGVSFLQYAEDNDEQLPPGIPGSTGEGWSGQVLPYHKAKSMYKCMNDQTTANASNLSVDSYGYNADLTGPENNNMTSVGLAYLNQPAKTVLLFEAVGNGSVDFSNDQTSYAANGTGIPQPAGVKFDTGYLLGMTPAWQSTYVKASTGRHTGGANYVFCDGHVLWLRPENVSSGGTSQDPNCYTRAAAPLPACTSTNNAAGTDVSSDTSSSHIRATFSPI